MTQLDDASPRGGPAEGAAFDVHGIEPVPASDRTATPLEQFWIWMGANLAPINWVLGALGITLGLSLVDTLLTVALGNLLGCAVFGLFNVMGHRTGVNQMVLSRSAFGRRGAYVPGLAQLLLAMGWIGVNTWIVLDLVIEVLAQLGYEGGSGTRYVVAFLIMAVQLGLATWGFYAIRTFEKWTVPVTALIMVAMTVLAVVNVDVTWGGGEAQGAAKFTAVTQLMTAIGVGWGYSWLTYSSDYSRFIRPEASERAVFWATAAGIYVPTVWLAGLGAAVASSGTESDPSDIVVTTFGAMSLPVLLLIMHGPIATNILNIYSSSLAALSLGIRAARWKVTLAAGLVGSVALVLFIRSASFATAFDGWMISILVWISPWAGIMLVDFFVLRRGRVDVAGLYADPKDSPYGDVDRGALVALVAGLVAGWAWLFGVVPQMRGPLALALGDTDFSWLTGTGVAGLVYWAVHRGRARRAAPARAEASG